MYADNYMPAVNAGIFQLQCSTDNGSTFVTAANYHGAAYLNNNGAITGTAGDASYASLSSIMSNAASVASSNILLTQLGNSITSWSIRTVYTNTAPTWAGYINDGYYPAAFNAYRLTFSNGNISSGTFSLYGFN